MEEEPQCTVCNADVSGDEGKVKKQEKMKSEEKVMRATVATTATVATMSKGSSMVTERHCVDDDGDDDEGGGGGRGGGDAEAEEEAKEAEGEKEEERKRRRRRILLRLTIHPAPYRALHKFNVEGLPWIHEGHGRTCHYTRTSAREPLPGSAVKSEPFYVAIISPVSVLHGRP